MAARGTRNSINRINTYLLESSRRQLREDGALAAKFLSDRVVLFTTAAVRRYGALVENDSPEYAVADSAPRGYESRIEFTYETRILTDVARRLSDIADIVESGDAFKTMYEWAKEDNYMLEPTIFQVFITPMLKVDKVRLPWTSEGESAIDARKSFAANALLALNFVESEGLDFIVQFILSGYWMGHIVNTRAGSRVVPFLTAPPLYGWSHQAYMPARFYGVMPFQTGIPLLLSPDVLASLYANNPGTSQSVVNRIYMKVLQVFFGVEMPFCSVEQDRRNWVASSMVDFVPDADSKQAFTTVRDFVELQLLTDPFVDAAFPDRSERKLYVARNLWNLKYGSELLSYFRSVEKYSSWFRTMKEVAGYLWYVGLLKAMTENDTYVEDALRILGIKPGEVELDTALEAFNPAQRKLAIKILTRHGINVPQNKLGDTGVIGQLSAMGINPTPDVQRQWSPETQQWYAEHVVNAQSSASDAVDRAFEPM